MNVPKTRRAPAVSDESRPEDIMEAIRGKSHLIAVQQRKADAGHFKDYGAAIGLQRLRQERQALQGLLAPLKLVEA